MSKRSSIYQKHDADVAFLDRVRNASLRDLAQLLAEHTLGEEWKRVAIRRAQLRDRAKEN
ncbi:MAG: hypothetical protein JWM74_4249 [Myxococcaceae bacterium]|jgi:hypothetical protein|nr:hypothetical protein [Myxococcaceae bacterium]